MEAPGTSGRPPAGFMTLTSWPLLYHSTAGSTSRGSLAQATHVDFSSQQSSAPIRLPTRAWRPSFQSGGSGSNKWSNKSHLHRPFALGVGAGTGGSMLYGSAGAAQLGGFWPFKSKAKSNGKAKKRVLVLMSDTGGGHRASAEAIRSGFQILYGNQYHLDIVDIWSQHTPWPMNQIPKTYSFLVKNGFLWRFGYYTQQPRFMHVPFLKMTAITARRHIAAVFDHYNPDLIVSVHPLLQLVPLTILQNRIKAGIQRPIKFATVVTDLTTCHNTWFHKDVDRCFVATEEAKQRALTMGIAQHKVTVHGLPIRPSFSQKLPSKHSLRQQLGMDLQKPAVLLVGGGEGMGAIEKIVQALIEQVGPACQVVAICGRNKGLIKRLEAKPYPAGMQVTIKGFVDNMPEWMTACDMIITKAGPGTIAESFICGLPVLLNGFVPCQEEGNVPFVLKHQVGAYEDKPAKIAQIIHGWVHEKRGELAAMSARAKEMGQPQAVFRIVEDLATMCA
ncbi:hypothetical protein WJX77_006919 [Trebouxia sp. C0004]